MSDIVGHASAERYWEGRWRDEAKRVAELEADRDEWRQAAQVEAGLRREFHDRVAELVGLICEVVNHGDASGDKKLLDRLMAATPEAGWVATPDGMRECPGCDAPLHRDIWRCDVTGNVVGTDTVMIGAPPCRCQGCRAAARDARVADLEGALRPLVSPLIFHTAMDWPSLLEMIEHARAVLNAPANAGGTPMAAHAHSHVLAAEPPSSRRGEPAPANAPDGPGYSPVTPKQRKRMAELSRASTEGAWDDPHEIARQYSKEVMPPVSEPNDRRADFRPDDTRPRPAQSPAGAVVVVSDEMVERLRANIDMRIGVRLTQDQAKDAIRAALAPEIGR